MVLGLRAGPSQVVLQRGDGPSQHGRLLDPFHAHLDRVPVAPPAPGQPHPVAGRSSPRRRTGCPVLWAVVCAAHTWPSGWAAPMARSIRSGKAMTASSKWQPVDCHNMATDRLRQLPRFMQTRARTCTPCLQSIRTWAGESHSCSLLRCGRWRKAARGLPGAAGGPAPQMRRPCPGPPTRSSHRWARANGVLLIEQDGNNRWSHWAEGQVSRTVTRAARQARPSSSSTQSITTIRQGSRGTPSRSATAYLTADTCALAQTGANYRASPSSWLDFARIADYLQRSTLGRRFDIKHRSSCSGYHHQQPAPA
jgi:hypothetical protein